MDDYIQPAGPVKKEAFLSALSNKLTCNSVLLAL